MALVLGGLLAGCALNPLPEPRVPVASRVLDANGQLVTSVFQENRIPVPLRDIPEDLRNAVVAVEDARFYRHYGVDPIGILRATMKNLLAGEVVEGGSTITQQLAKNLYLTPRRTLTRKLQEIYLAIKLERTYTKDEILEMYLNQIYFGEGAYGVEVASRTYFGKSVRELDISESTLLAGLPRAPSRYSPFTDLEAALGRRKVVLRRMVEQGMLSPESAHTVDETPVELAARQPAGRAAYVVQEIQRYIASRYPEGEDLLYRGGLTIYTTLDRDMQVAAEDAVKQGMVERDVDLEAALVAVDPKNGYIKAMVGGRRFSKSQYNRATRRPGRQPGSAMKPFLYAAAIDRGFTEASIFRCEPVSFPQPTGEVYAPTDYGKPFHYRDMTLKEALKVSDNIVAVRLNAALGPEAMADYARRLGITTSLRPFLSLALGTSEVVPVELAAAYGPFASQGLKAKPFLILQVLDREGRTLEENRPLLEFVLDPRTSYVVTDMLISVLKPGGTASHLAPLVGRVAAGKTGSTQEYRDGWFVGYTTELVAAVWVGFDDYRRPVGIPGGVVAGPIWAQFMREALKDIPPHDFPIPAGVVTMSVCTQNGKLATSACPSPMQMSFLEGTAPSTWCDVH
ncbi:penicillin-binding protein [Clostridiales bacterium PH28_bin88]|nr:penicillin-binding protein [Clostridiales bacterium PH28_bin88]